MAVDLWVEITLHNVFLVVTIVCAYSTTLGIGDLYQTTAVEEELCPSTVGSKSQERQSWFKKKPLAALDVLEAAMFNSELLRVKF